MARWILTVSFAGWLGLIAGCGDAETPEEPLDMPAWLTGQDAPAEHAPRPDGVVAAPPLEKATLGLNLQPGMKFPLLKTVDQELIQSPAQGVPETVHSRLEMFLAITVEEKQSDRTRLRVRYDRVRFSTNLGGEQIEYDSAHPTISPAPAVQAYHAMVGDGFAFWIGADNQIVGIDGFKEFLDRCLQSLPPEQRQAALLEIESTSGERGIADFVDNTIGLLPFQSKKVIGESWTRQRSLMRPVPMKIAYEYTLKNFDDQVAAIHVSGQITPSTTLGTTTADSEPVRVTIRGGRADGTCEIYRDTGLPRMSRVVEDLDMVVHLSGGVQFDQRKRTVTSIQAFPTPSGGNSVYTIGLDGGVEQMSQSPRFPEGTASR